LLAIYTSFPGHLWGVYCKYTKHLSRQRVTFHLCTRC